MTYVSNIQRYSVHDGPGIRTVVFLLGCPLRCKWCQNPENLQAFPVLLMDHSSCIGCGECIKTCPKQAIYPDAQGHITTDFSRCIHCFACTDICFAQARQPAGRIRSVDEVFAQVMRDEAFFRHGGGVTLSGGDPTVHPQFCYELLTKCKQQGIHTAMETCGHVSAASMQRLSEVTDLFLYDIKAVTPQVHRKWTGVDNAQILENLRWLCAHGHAVIPRVPLIPGVNDSDEEFGKIVDLVVSLGLDIIHILPFHQYGSGKYLLAQIPYELADLPEDNEERIAACIAMAQQRGLKVSRGGS